MLLKTVRRISASQGRLRRIFREVEETGQPVIIQEQGNDQVAVVSLRDFQRLHPAEAPERISERERVRAALHAAGLLSEPTPAEVAEARAWAIQHPAEEQERILEELRRLRLDPPLSEIILRNRDRDLD